MFKEGAVKGALLLFNKIPTHAFQLDTLLTLTCLPPVSDKRIFNFNIKQLQTELIFSPSLRFAQNLNYPILFI